MSYLEICMFSDDDIIRYRYRLFWQRRNLIVALSTGNTKVLSSDPGLEFEGRPWRPSSAEGYMTHVRVCKGKWT